MFRQVVVGTDGSETATRAVHQAARVAARESGALHIVSAYGPAMREDLERLRQGGGTVTSVLEEAAASVQELGCSVETHELDGDPADAIVAFAEEIEADVVVVGNKGLGGVKGFLLGSVPSKVVKNAPCSVLVVRTTD